MWIVWVSRLRGLAFKVILLGGFFHLVSRIWTGLHKNYPDQSLLKLYLYLRYIRRNYQKNSFFREADTVQSIASPN